ncbi:MAG TPA: DivIVA domain-containing protein [Oligoflexia bacterium]|nr:DivIVA domain-containing protein [Oligoflexia bacterium]HMR23745.1 DivIVA domain-containing protein [Oligoflexia bacterium]
MKLTPLDLLHKKFNKKTFGFDPKEVADFLKDIQLSWEEDRASLIKKEEEIAQLERLIVDFREKESTLKQTVISAQKVSEEMKRSGEKEAQMIKEEANVQAERMLNQAHNQLNNIMHRINALKQQKADFLGHLRGLIQTHDNLLKMHENNDKN